MKDTDFSIWKDKQKNYCWMTSVWRRMKGEERQLTEKNRLINRSQFSFYNLT